MSNTIEVEVDEYQLRTALEDALDGFGLDTIVKESVEEAINSDEIQRAVEDGFEAANFIEALTAIRARLDALDEKKKDEEVPDANGNFYGFKPGEEVILFNRLHPEGLRGTVDPDVWDASTWTNVVPVLRADTQEGDGFPVQQTILAGPLDAFLESRVGSVVKEAEAEIQRASNSKQPVGDPISWNLKVFENAIENQSGTVFVYRTPNPSYMSDTHVERTRRFRPSIIDRIGPEGRQSIVKGFDVDAQDVRSFRVDRIQGYVSRTATL